MDNRKQALTDLLSKIEAGDRSGLCKSMAVQGWPGDPFPDDWASRIDAAYNGSLDAAKALHEAVLCDYVWIASAGCVEVYGPKEGQKFITFCEDETPARAWLIAIIKALIAKADA